MTGVLQFAALGLGTGAILALLSLGLVVIYRGAGVVNLAHGAFALVAAWMTWELQGRGWPTPLAVLGAVVVVAALGYLTDQLLLRRLRTASALARVIATLGVLLTLTALVRLIWGVVPQVAEPVLPTTPVKLGSLTIPSDRLEMLAIALFLTWALTFVWTRTRAGWVAEAVSENQRLSASLGWSPELVSALTWTLGAAMAALAGVFIAPITQLDSTTMPLLVVPALAAALLAGFRSFWLALAASLAIGVAQSLLGRYVEITGITDGFPFLVIIAVLVFRGSPLPLRGHAFDRLPRIGSGRVRWTLVVPTLIATLAFIKVMDDPEWQSAITGTLTVGIILLSFVVLIGYTGQISLAQYTIAGLGALVASRTSVDAGWSFPAALLAGAVTASLVGVVFALPALRTRGINLAIVTLGLALATNSMVFGNPTFVGPLQGLVLPSPTLFGYSIDPLIYPMRYTIFTLIVFVLLALGVTRLRRRALGRTLLAVRDNERGAAASGVNIVGAKILGFALAGLIAGIGGVVQAFQQPVAIFNTGYDPMTSIAFVGFSVIGGVGFVIGALLGAEFSPTSFGSVLTLHVQGFDKYIGLLGGVFLLMTLINNPHGWAYEVVRSTARFFKKQVSRLTATETPQTPERVEPRALAVEGLVVKYGPTTAIDQVGVNVQPASVTGCIGPNGAGKTSFMDGVTGFITPAGGTVQVGRRNVSRKSAHKVAAAGLARSFQNLELYPDLTVLENILAASDTRSVVPLLLSPSALKGRQLSPKMAAVIVEFGLQDSLDLLPEELSYGQRRLLAVARAIAQEPSVLLLDEPAAGLDETESAELGRVIRSLADKWGVAILLVEHDINLVMAISDHIVVIDFGVMVAEGTPAEIRVNPVAIAAYLGTDDLSHHEIDPTDPAPHDRSPVVTTSER